MKNLLKKLLALALIASVSTTYAQKAEPPKAVGAAKSSLLAVHFDLGFSALGGDLKTRFSSQAMLGTGLDFLTKKNWIVAADAQYFFGNKVNEDPLAALRTPEGLLIGNDRRATDAVFKSRGWAVGASAGRLFSFSERQRASGIRLTVGAGWAQHKIRIQDDSKSLPQIAGDYRKGYDRLTGGLNLKQTVGYQLFSKSRKGNVFVGCDFHQSRSRSLRDFDFALGKKDETKRLDLRFVPRVSLCVPFYFNDRGEDVFY